MDVVFPEVGVRLLLLWCGGLMEGEDIGCGFELGDGYEADLC